MNQSQLKSILINLFEKVQLTLFDIEKTTTKFQLEKTNSVRFVSHR